MKKCFVSFLLIVLTVFFNFSCSSSESTESIDDGGIAVPDNDMIVDVENEKPKVVDNDTEIGDRDETDESFVDETIIDEDGGDETQPEQDRDEIDSRDIDISAKDEDVSDSDAFQVKNYIDIKAHYNGAKQPEQFVFVLSDSDDIVGGQMKSVVNANLTNSGNLFSGEARFENLDPLKDYYVGVYADLDMDGALDIEEPYMLYDGKSLETVPATALKASDEGAVTIEFGDSFFILGSIKAKVLYTGNEIPQNFTFLLYENADFSDQAPVKLSVSNIVFSGGIYSAEAVFEGLLNRSYYLGVFLDNESIGDINDGEAYIIYENKTIAELPATAVNPSESSDIEMQLGDSYLFCNSPGEKKCRSENSFITCTNSTWSAPESCGDGALCSGAGVCDCTLLTCESLPIGACGTFDDGCGARLKCGDCVFQSSVGGDFDQHMNGLWDTFGKIVDEAVYRFGNEPTWYEWMGLKLMWSDLKSDQDHFLSLMQHWAMDEDGYLWSWADNENWPTGEDNPPGYRHYDNNPKYILGIYRYLMWSGDDSVLYNSDQTTSVNSSVNPAKKTDVSNGMTILDKLRKAMDFMLVQYDAGQGLLKIRDPRNNGTDEGHPSDYWDNHLNGYLNSTINTYFYAALKAMAVIERRVGDPLSKAATYDQMAGVVKTSFNTLFWNETTKRYVSTVDINGTKWDFGSTYLQFEALYYGLSDETKAADIFDWMDGTRVVSSDMFDGKGATGAEIYNKFKWAAVANTKPLESYSNPTTGNDWWESIRGQIRIRDEYCIPCGTVEPPNASWGIHLENGGAILYTSFYDIMSRFMYKNANDAHKRMLAITHEYGIDNLKRDPGGWIMGIIGEYPESGLVPTVFLYGYLGLDAVEQGLIIKPDFPIQMSSAKINELNYYGNVFDIEAKASASGTEKIVIDVVTAGDDFTLLAKVKYQSTKYSIDHRGTVIELTSDASGNVDISLADLQNGDRILIEKQ